MQEQHHYKTTPDQGWAKMRPMLDEAMPVGTASRRYPFLWWTTTAVVLAGLVGFTLLKDTIGESNSSSVVNRSAIVPAIVQHVKQQNNTNTPASQLNETKEIISSSKTPASGQPAIEGKELIKPNFAPKPAITNSKSGSPKKAEQKKAVSIPMAVVDDKESENSRIEAEVVSEPMLTTADVPPVSMETNSSSVSALIANPPLRNGQVINALPVLQEVSLNTPGYLQDMVPSGTVLKSKPQPSFIEPTLAVSGFAGQQGGLGAFGGAGINMNISRRFSVTSSVGYFTFNPNGALLGGSTSLNANAEYNAILNYDPTYPGNEIYVEADAINNLTDYNTISPLVDKVTQWQINAGLKWKFGRRFFTEGGVTLGLHTRAISTYPIAQLDPQSSTPGVRFKNELNEFDVIRSTTTAMYAGIGYRLGQHIDLFANWNHGLDQYLLNDTVSPTTDLDSGKRTDYIRGLSLGVRYTL